MAKKDDYWKDDVLFCVRELCAEHGSRTFTMAQLFAFCGNKLRKMHPGNNTPRDKIRQKLQLLRKEKKLSFVNNRGTYTYREQLLLPGEVDDEKIGEVFKSRPERREYVMETFARDRGWVREAKNAFGHQCMVSNCGLTFRTASNKPYIEVHHIIPLFEGGEDGVWNLSVLCAHHHRMAHFAIPKVRGELGKFLAAENKKILRKKGRANA